MDRRGNSALHGRYTECVFDALCGLLACCAGARIPKTRHLYSRVGAWDKSPCGWLAISREYVWGLMVTFISSTSGQASITSQTTLREIGMSSGVKHHVSEDTLAQIQGKRRRRGPETVYTPERFKTCARCGNKSGTLRWVFLEPAPSSRGEMRCMWGCGKKVGTA